MIERLDRVRNIGWLALLGVALLVAAALGVAYLILEGAAAVRRWAWRR